MTGRRRPLYYTFGNHMHWVDMEWLWGYFVLPSSVRDMLHLCVETGAKGNINFDAIGYEKMASEAPAALVELRDAVARGQIEVVGASYGQPYGLFHGGESNVRQRVYGARTVRRLLGVWPRTFWEEEFDFFPQLPQILRGAGFAYASLFFQWTWHTPEVPRETIPAVWWEGQDGSRLLTSTRNALNLHQWPEDFESLLDSPLLHTMPGTGIVQWLELMPSPDWMCRSELLLPPLRALLEHPRLEIRPVTLSEYLEQARPHAETRRYTLDDVFHGMSLGKNGDLFRRLSRKGEQALLAAEAISVLAGFFGRPYPGWNVYPTWELEEAWRELLVAQHHDNDECEGLTGHIGLRSHERSQSLTRHVTDRTLKLLAERTRGAPSRTLVYNPLGWARDAVVPRLDGEGPAVVRDLPPFGYRAVTAGDAEEPAPVRIETVHRAIALRRGPLSVVIDRTRGVIAQITSAAFPRGALDPDRPLADLTMTRREQVDHFAGAQIEIRDRIGDAAVVVRRTGREGAAVTVTVSLAPDLDAVDLRYEAHGLPRPDPWLRAALRTAITVNLPQYRLIHDHPYGVSEIRAEGTYLRKYPTSDWMTSAQVFEEIHNPLTALQLLDFDAGDRGLLYLHDGSQAFLRDGRVVDNVLSMYDAWDEDYFVADLDARVRLVPHGPITHADRWRLAQEFTRPALVQATDKPGGDLPAIFGPVWCDAPNVAVTAFFRETAEAGAFLDRYAGAGVDVPHILRLVEFNGEPAVARLTVPGPVATAVRASVRGDALDALPVSPAAAPLPGSGDLDWHQVVVALRPYEIATVYLDLVLGRKINRNLDDYRSMWAMVHRIEELAEERP